MNTLIVYDSQFGNTERIARAVAEHLGSARMLQVEEEGMLKRTECELLIVAGPTHHQGMSPAIQAWLEHLERGELKDVPAVAFDTRYRMSRFLSGSAVVRIAHCLKRAGGRLVVPPESFFIERDVPPHGEKRRHAMERLEPGEEGRASERATNHLKRMVEAQQSSTER